MTGVLVVAPAVQADGRRGPRVYESLHGSVDMRLASFAGGEGIIRHEGDALFRADLNICSPAPPMLGGLGGQKGDEYCKQQERSLSAGPSGMA